MGGQNKSTGSTTTTSTSPPGMSQLMSGAKGVFDKGTAWAPNTSSMVTPFSTQTNQAMTGMQNVANSSTGAFDQNFKNITGLTQDGGLNALQQQQVNRLNPIASGDRMNSNPYLEDLIKRSGDDIRYQTGLGASAMGRYGSGGHEGVTGKAIGDMSGNLRYQNYGDEANRQMDAIGSLFNAGTQQRQNVAAGTGQLSDAYNARLSPYNTLSQVGAKNEDLYSRTLADKSRIFSEKQNAQTAPINWMANLLGAAGGGQSVTNTSVPSNPLAGGVGGALAGYDTFGGPLGALFGGGLGAFL